ncbi:hypothetical protein NLU13_4083 [Sarocladium strictum]|uniref:CFEM domain-containing protein n=1 Tax=Sarocladium strictum TaxID=5046 RepID=A0AA39GJL3_SARSR|nr:hypothetical protein NLU13_4083 [Sarocladium strictum]
MKATIVALLAASLVSAQSFDGIPKCAQECLQEAIPQAGCGLQDTACQCLESTQMKLRSLAAPCFLSQCEPNEVLQAQSAGNAACEAFKSATATVSDAGTTGLMSILPTDVLPPISSPATTPGAPSITTISSIATPPSGGNLTTTRTTTGDDSNETGGSGGGSGSGGNGGSGDNAGTTTSTDAAPMATAGLVAALFAAAIAI